MLLEMLIAKVGKQPILCSLFPVLPFRELLALPFYRHKEGAQVYNKTLGESWRGRHDGHCGCCCSDVPGCVLAIPGFRGDVDDRTARHPGAVEDV
jgi:hypothetical protein